MDILDRIRQRAASRPQHIVLPEGNDPRTVVAAAEATSQRVARITVLGDEETIRGIARDNQLDLGGVTIIDHKRAADFDKMVALFHDLRRAKGLMADEARTLVSDPLYYGNLMVRSGLADGSVAGATNTTSHTVRAALHCIGVRSGFKLVSSFFLMALRNSEFGHEGAMIYADCGVVIEPSAVELAEIALAAADSCRALLGTEPRVALLSFSTKGSAKHRLIDKVVEATRTVKARAPELLVDGELQADAALIPVSRAVEGAGIVGWWTCKRLDLSRSAGRKHRLQVDGTDWPAPPPSGRFSRVWTSPQTISREAAPRATSSTQSRSPPSRRRPGKHKSFL